MKIHIFGAIISLFCAIAEATAQEGVVSAMTVGDLSPTQSEALRKLQSLPTTQDLQVVRVDVAELREADSFTIPLPGRAAVEVAADGKVNQTDSEFSFSGDTESLETTGLGTVGQSTFAVNGDSITGSIQTETGLYRIRPLGGLYMCSSRWGPFRSTTLSRISREASSKIFPRC